MRPLLTLAQFGLLLSGAALLLLAWRWNETRHREGPVIAELWGANLVMTWGLSCGVDEPVGGPV